MKIGIDPRQMTNIKKKNWSVIGLNDISRRGFSIKNHILISRQSGIKTHHNIVNILYFVFFEFQNQSPPMKVISWLYNLHIKYNRYRRWIYVLSRDLSYFITKDQVSTTNLDYSGKAQDNLCEVEVFGKCCEKNTILLHFQF